MDRTIRVPFSWSNPLLRSLVFCAAMVPACAQFKEIKEAPFPLAVARKKIVALLENADAGNRDRTVEQLSSLLDWYRDILDEELIARWKSENRANLVLLMAPLADARVASQVIDFSWREQRQATFNLTYAPLLGDLMARYPESARLFLNDLLNDLQQPGLSLTEAQAVCRILLDMPDVGTWRKTALQILPRYRQVVDNLLKQDLNSPDQEAVYRALRWRADLRLDPPVTSQKQNPRPTLQAPKSFAPSHGSTPRPHIVSPPAYDGPTSGTFQSTGGPIPQNAEYVFHDVPPVKLRLDFDTKHWEARLEQGDGGAQVLVLKNIGKGPQKRCVVHWSLMP